MNIEVNTTVSGFRVERIRFSSELGGNFVGMAHVKTGARLCWVDNGDSNKLFCIGFKTLPEDSTGVFHILEHSVLCGSEKYPVKEPFVDLMKSSMNTFLNAMTFQDKTIYPVSSRNERDFLNLTSVYLDAVFAPRCVIDPNAFRQEGWHLEVGEDGKPFINGVVYNEMKGATSGIDDILGEGMHALLFPDNCYGFNSGGEPANIPELTYDMYKAMYHKYYHPSNAYIFLDGAVPLEKTLSLIDGYLDRFERQEALHEIPLQQPRVGESTLYYEIGADENEKRRAALSFGRICGDWSDKRMQMMTEILCALLADTNEAPLKRAILAEGLGDDVDLSLEDGVYQPVLMLTVRNTDEDRKQAILDKTAEVVRELLAKGLDKELLTAQINRYAFRVKDKEPAGLIRCITSYNSSLYGGDPMLYLEYDEDIAALRKAAEGDGFDKLLAELLDPDKLSVLTVLPSKTHGEKLREEEAARAEAMLSAMNDNEKQELAAANERLHAWQDAPDDPEDTAKLPVLPLSEVGAEPMYTPTELHEEGGVTVMYHPVPSQGITHINLYFNLSELTLPELSAAQVMTKLLSKLPTAKHDTAELQKLIKTYIGRLHFDVRPASHGSKSCTPYLAVFCDVLDENLKRAEELIREILCETLFDKPDRIKETVLQLDEMTKQRMITAGHAVGIDAVKSHYLSAAAVTEATGGYTFRSYIKELSKEFEAKAPELVSLMERIRDNAMVRAGLTVGVTATEMPCVCGLINSFPEGKASPASVHYESPVPERFGVRIPAQVSFAERGVACEVGGSMKVAANLITLACLWNRVRVQGGAYGVGLTADERGCICHYSYRDPSPARSIGVYGEEPDFITEFCNSGEDLTKYIISAIGRTEPLNSPAMQGAIADMDCLEGTSIEDARKLRAEMLNTDAQALLAVREALEACRENGCICVVGCDSALAGMDMPVFDI